MSVAVGAELPGVETLPARRERGKAVALWLATAMIVIVYGAFLGRLIAASTVVPTHDQAAYMAKTYALADAVYEHPSRLIWPSTYFGEPAANRPPLMMFLAALVVGPHATPAAIGITWLVIRLLVLLAALAVVARMVGSSAWVPAAALAILAAPGGLTLHYNMYMMDQPFEAFGLLAFGLLAGDNLKQNGAAGGWRRAAWGAFASLLLFLVKPAALVFLSPMVGMLAIRWWLLRRADPRPGVGWTLIRRWAWPYFVFGGAVLVILFATPLGFAVAQQYQLGSRGYWAQHQGPIETLGLLALVAPPWLLALAGLSVAWRGWKWPGMRDQRFVVVAAVVTAGWWYVFNAWITYTLDARILSAAMPVAVVGGLLVVGRSARMLAAATAVAAVLFAASLLCAAERFRMVRGARSMCWRRCRRRRPIQEVGILELARRLKQTVAAAEAEPPMSDALDGERIRCVMMVTSDDFVELNAMRLAMGMRYDQAAGRYDGWLFLDSHPWGAHDFKIETVANFEWFVTKNQRKFPKLGGDVWTSLLAIDALITDPKSPWHGKFERVFDLPIHQPDLEDVVTVWRLPRRPTDEELLEGRDFVAPRFKGTAGEAMLAHERAEIVERMRQ